MSGRSRIGDTDIWPDNRKEWAVSLVLVGGFLLTVLVLLFFPSGLVGLGQELWAVLVPGSAGPGPGSAEALTLTTDDAQFLNRNFREQTHMQAYCGLLEAGGTLKMWSADIDSAGPNTVSFSVENCPLGDYPDWAVVLTHPNGQPAPTEQDRAAFRSVDASYLCIQSAPLTAQPGERPTHFRCYESADGDGSGLTQVAVRLKASG